jgi:hypothetical protein
MLRHHASIMVAHFLRTAVQCGGGGGCGASRPPGIQPVGFSPRGPVSLVVVAVVRRDRDLKAVERHPRHVLAPESDQVRVNRQPSHGLPRASRLST